MEKILDLTKSIMSRNSEDPVSSSAFKVVQAIGFTMSEGEESSLMNTLPAVMGALRARRNTTLAMAALVPLSLVLFTSFWIRPS
jgi:hypothetical protein